MKSVVWDILPDGTETLADRAINSCPNLKSVTIPASVTSIGTGNFADCGNVVIRTPNNSYAWQWASEHNIPVAEIP